MNTYFYSYVNFYIIYIIKVSSGHVNFVRYLEILIIYLINVLLFIAYYNNTYIIKDKY